MLADLKSFTKGNEEIMERRVEKKSV